MTAACNALDNLMERASEALAKMEYLGCEALCVEALASARAAGQWDYYSRILLPLQEVRRQRRMIAAGGRIRLGSGTLDGRPGDWLDHLSPGCIVLTRPHDIATAKELSEQLMSGQRYGEVLWADNDQDHARWVLRSFSGVTVSCEVDAPPAEWVDRWLVMAPGSGDRAAQHAGAGPTSRTPADWFIDASESLGDAALASVRSPIGQARRVEELEACVRAVPDHEILHQRLAEAAHALAVAA